MQGFEALAGEGEALKDNANLRFCDRRHDSKVLAQLVLRILSARTSWLLRGKAFRL